MGQRNIERSKGSRVLLGIDLLGRWRHSSHAPAQIECQQGKQKQSTPVPCFARTERAERRQRYERTG